MNGPLRWLRARMGVRVVSALAAAGAVAVVLVVAGLSLVLLLNQSLRSTVADAGQQQAEVLGQRIQANFSGTGDAKRNALEATGKRGDLVQVVTDYSNDSDENRGPDGYAYVPDKPEVQIIGSSDTLDDQARMSDVVLDPGQQLIIPSTVITRADGTTDEVLLVAEGYSAQGRPITVLVGQPLLPVHQAVDTVEVMVMVGVPILVLVTGFFTYLFSSRALRPVEAIRRRVAGLTDRDLSTRVPEPVTQDEVGKLARTMNGMLSRLQESQATQRRFVADASHELRSPLATVSTGLELLGAGMPEDSADMATVQTLRGETTRLTSLVENLLFLARADERGLTPRREEVDLDEIAEAERVRPSADDRVAVTVSTEPVRVTGDRGQLVRVLRNLVDNARRHAGHAVLVTVHGDGETAVVDVEDDGPGVPEADRARVFERFVRLDEARARGDGGSGLGLAIVSELVAAHGGSVAVDESTTLGGARFRVSMPMAAAEPDPVEDDDQQLSVTAGDTTGETVAGAEDERMPVPPAPTGGPPWEGPRPGRPSPGPVRTPVTPHPVGRSALDPPTGPLPIRPNTVGSPADQNATRPLPIVPRTGTAVATPPGGTRETPGRPTMPVRPRRTPGSSSRN
ncbi:sensor histidine kinase [Pseudonocardia endophytica]|uniref:sensor histidine kinase n=1 Tax=Pseudonocardia endophytica TaxID=401976 RepID=UPI00104C8686|nr:HAMP domain-containing sensor histidine kinase [Pseudonocardia endophytica]